MKLKYAGSIPFRYAMLDCVGSISQAHLGVSSTTNLHGLMYHLSCDTRDSLFRYTR